MFYINNTGTTIYINRELSPTDTYSLVFKNKDEFNVEYTTSIIPTISNSRYSSFIIDIELKEGTYKFFIYDNEDDLIYNDICKVNLTNEKVTIIDNSDKKIIIG